MLNLRLAALAMLAAGVVAHGRRSRAVADSSFIDAHMHLNEPDSALDLIGRSGITAGVAFIGARGTNESVLQAAARSGGRLIPFASVTPERREYRSRWMRDDSTIAEDLDRMLASGPFRGIGELSIVHFSGDGFPEADFDPNGLVMRAIMTVAARRRLPVMIHCEVTRLREFSALLECRMPLGIWCRTKARSPRSSVCPAFAPPWYRTTPIRRRRARPRALLSPHRPTARPRRR